eukprot:14519561-Ditylum_brightwellii.AAC.1
MKALHSCDEENPDGTRVLQMKEEGEKKRTIARKKQAKNKQKCCPKNSTNKGTAFIKEYLKS